MNNKEFEDVKKVLNCLDAYNNPTVDLVVSILGIGIPAVPVIKEILNVRVNEFQVKKT